MIHFLEQHFVELVTITSIIYLTLATILLSTRHLIRPFTKLFADLKD